MSKTAIAVVVPFHRIVYTAAPSLCVKNLILCIYRHQSREAEPKDYDVNEAPLGKKNLCHSTYRRFGNVSSEVSIIYVPVYSSGFFLAFIFVNKALFYTRHMAGGLGVIP